jgi:hypothetical protein
MRQVKTIRLSLPLLLLACLLWTGACAMYDIQAFGMPEGLEDAAAAETLASTTETTQPPAGAGETSPSGTPVADAPVAVPDPSGFVVYPTAALSVTLAWDPPASTITGYRVYYRTHDQGAWMPLGDVAPSAQPVYVVDYPGLGNGDFDFAVKALNGTAESGIHTSLDGTAMPAQGWYLRWGRTE